MSEKLYSTAEVSAMLKLSAANLSRYARKYDDIGMKIGNSWVFTEKHLERIRWHMGKTWVKNFDYRP